MHVFLIHGTYGNPEENWFLWLRAELEKHGHSVHTPSFPTPEGQTLERWRAAFGPYERFLAPDAVIVAHSVGCAFALDILERHRVGATVLASGFASRLGNRFDRINKTFVDREFDWETIKGNCASFSVFQGEKDPYVPLARGRELAHHLATALLVIGGGGHLNADAGFVTFPEVLDAILSSCRT